MLRASAGDTTYQADFARVSTPVQAVPRVVASPLSQRRAAQWRRPLGNQATLRMLSLPRPTLQTKLTINTPGDAYEPEADRVADQAMRMTDADIVVSQAPARVSRKSAAGEEEDKKKLQMQSADGAALSGAEAPQIVHETLQEPGRPLDPATRAFFEPRFGCDFGEVRVHSGAKAAKSAREIGALAYAVGGDLVFAREQASFRSAADERLLAHELTHVLQQRAAGRPAALTRSLASSRGGLPDGATTPANTSLAGIVDDPHCLKLRPGAGPERCQFTDRQQNILSTIQYAARSQTAAALTNLSRGDPYMSALAARIFHVSAPKMSEVIATTAKILDKLRSVPLVCGSCADETCYLPDVPAYTADDLSVIVLCLARFFSSGATGMRRTLIHEAGHASGIDFSRGGQERYCDESSATCDDPCANLTGDLTHNVDAWARFIECSASSG